MTYDLKRYSNRRLYDPHLKRNVTLDEVAELVRDGRKVRVLDNQSGEDITVKVLGQSFLATVSSWPDRMKSLELLRSLIREGGDSSMEILKKTVLASLGAFEVTRQKAEEIIDSLIQKGEIAKSKRSEAIIEMLDKAQESTKGIKDKVTDDVTRVVENMKLAKKKDLDSLEAKVDELIETIRMLEGKIEN